MDKRKEIKRLQEILEMMKEVGVFSHRTYEDHWWSTYGRKYQGLIKQYKKELKKTYF
jgi:TFIIF-interacting CTD phosphatase-like protein